MTMPTLPELPFFRYERHEVRMFLLDYAAAAYSAGQEAMRERAAKVCDTLTVERDGIINRHPPASWAVEVIRALPIDAD